jgi:heat shock protein HslJ
MRLTSAGASALAWLALCLSPSAWSQALRSSADPIAEAITPAGAQRFEQAWDVLSIMGKPLPPTPLRQPRVVLRPQGSLLVDGGCNRFSGRFERDAQGLFRVSKYGGTHGACGEPPRSEALLNSALMMADSFRWERGALVLLGGQSELLRLQPSANQDSQEIEQALVRPPVTGAESRSVQAPTRQVCRPVKTAKSRKMKAGKIKASRVVCQPVKGVKGSKGIKGSKMSASKAKLSAKSRSLKAIKSKSTAKSRKRR